MSLRCDYWSGDDRCVRDAGHTGSHHATSPSGTIGYVIGGPESKGDGHPCDRRPPTDEDDLLRVIGAVLPVEERGCSGLVTFRMDDGTRLSFLCGPTGRLNGVVIQRNET